LLDLQGMLVLEGQLSASGRLFGIVAARTNDLVVGRLLDGALDALKRHGASEADLVVVRTPGAWEVPLALRDLARSRELDAMIALAAVLRGGTPHFEYVSNEISKGVVQVSLEVDLPIGFGVLTCDSLEQALERSGAKGGNKGFDAAMAAIETADLRARLRSQAAR
jgi:6,7-dimethyl-8-ribityllumazine synthase